MQGVVVAALPNLRAAARLRCGSGRDQAADELVAQTLRRALRELADYPSPISLDIEDWLLTLMQKEPAARERRPSITELM